MRVRSKFICKFVTIVPFPQSEFQVRCVWFLPRAIRESKQNTERPHFEWHMRAFETVLKRTFVHIKNVILCKLLLSFYWSRKRSTV